ncbi:MAG: hypothetical protein IKD26_02100 [Clostridia bacterium]|nr:hypothetical protein [Clostridia bacterium]
MKKLVFLLLIIFLLGGVTGCTHFVEQDIQVAGWNYCDVNNNQMVFENIDAQIVNLSKPSDIVHSVVFYPRNYNKTIDELKDNKYFVFSHDYKIASTAVNNYYFFKDNAYYYLTTLADSANDKHLQLFSCCATDGGFSSEEELVEFCRLLYVDNGTEVLCTLGEKGAVFVGKEGVFKIRSQRISPCDPTGAGDAFLAAFAFARYAEKKSCADALHFANDYVAEKLRNSLSSI